ncbi:MAG: acyltransferase [Planctomycetota bacterium]|nr:acyltransferase [Planctomycetota bacterium]
MQEPDSIEPCPSGQGHILALDGVRGVAILLVLGYHNRPMLDQSNWYERLWVRLFDSGWYGVDLFFVLCGFLITGILLDTLDRKAYLRSFAMRRVLRIFPLYDGVLFGLLVVAPLMLGWGDVIGVSKPRFGQQIWHWLDLPTGCPSLLTTRHGGRS